MKQLPEKTVRLITSGQVITSVSDAVKELVENSIDAGATSIEVKVENFGLSKIEIQDNGYGVREEDVEVMCKAHFTSKISRHEDLLELGSYGFRGEALHSLAALSNLTITSKTKQDTVGKSYSVNHKGEITDSKPIPIKVGTSIIVKDLFKNLPVRYQVHNSSPKKKLEMRKIQDVMIEFGLIHPWLKISLKHDKNLIWQKATMETLKENASYIFGVSLMKELQELSYKCTENSIEIYGFIPLKSSDSAITGRSTADKIKLYFNKRPVTVTVANKLLKELYSKALDLQTQMFPISFLNIKIDPGMLDINIEPNKRSILCEKMDDVIKALEESISSLYNLEPSLESVDAIPDHGNEDELDTYNECRMDNKEMPGNDPNVLTIDRDVNNINTNNFMLDIATSSVKQHQTSSIDADTVDNNEQLTIDCHPMLNITGKDNNKKTNSSFLASIANVDNQTTGFDKSKVNTIPSTFNEVSTYNKENVNQNNSSMIIDNISDDDELDLILQDLNDDSCAGESNQSTTKTNSEIIGNDYTNLPGGLSWSKGLINSKSNQSRLQPVAILTSSTSNDHLEAKRERSHSAMHNSSPSYEPPRKRQSLLTPLRVTRTDSHVYKNSYIPLEINSITMDIDLEKMRDSSTQSQTQCSIEEEKVNFIGQLTDPYKCMLVRYGKEIHVVNAYRLQEISIFERMLANQRISIDQLFEPIKLDKTNIPNDIWSVFAWLSFEHRSEDLSRYILDERITANGFNIKINTVDESNLSGFEIVGLASEIPFFGISDLLEILKCLSQDSDISIRDCRPLKVIAYLKSEAVRITRKSKTAFDPSSVVSNLEKFGIDSFCFHEHPICHKLTPCKFQI